MLVANVVTVLLDIWSYVYRHTGVVPGTVSSDERNLALVEAVRADDIQAIQEALDNYADVNARDNSGYWERSVLETAFHRGQSDKSAKLLIANGADIHAANYHHQTPLHMATMRGFYNVVQQLLEMNADVDGGQGPGIATPLHLAIEEDQPKIALLLLQHDADVNAKTIYGQSPLSLAASINKTDMLEVVRELISRNANVNSEDVDSNTPLHEAADSCNSEVVDMLIQHHANVDAQYGGYNLSTPLHNAVRSGMFGCLYVVKVLLRNGADVNAKDRYGWTPLHWAVKEDKMEMVRVLVENQANLEAADNKGRTPLNLAIKAVFSYTDDGSAKWVETHWARVMIAQFLIENGANVDIPVEVYRWHPVKSPLHLTSYRQGKHQSCQLYLAKLLIAHGADVNSSISGQTPLHDAAHYDCSKIAQELISSGADVDSKSRDGQVPLDRAIYRNSLETFKVLVDNGANTTLIDTFSYRSGYNFLHKVAGVSRTYSKGKIEMARILLNHDLDINANVQREDYRTALHIAIVKNDEDFVEFLLENGANTEARDWRGWTSRRTAMELDRDPILRLLGKYY